MDYLLEKALAVGADRKRLRARLQEAVAVLRSDVGATFRRPKFDFKRRSLEGTGEWYLQWVPIAPCGHATSTGTVLLVRRADQLASTLTVNP